jgi:hypothetical protein
MKGKTTKDYEDDKSVSSAKSIKSFTKQVKTLKKLVSMLQTHQEDSNDNSSLSSADGDVHFQYACAAIATTNPKVAIVLKSLNRGSAHKIGQFIFAPNIIFRVGSCIYMPNDLTCQVWLNNSTHTQSYGVNHCSSVLLTHD